MYPPFPNVWAVCMAPIWVGNGCALTVCMTIVAIKMIVNKVFFIVFSFGLNYSPASGNGTGTFSLSSIFPFELGLLSNAVKKYCLGTRSCVSRSRMKSAPSITT